MGSRHHHHGVVVVHPICRGLPHFGLPLLLVSTNQPPQGEARWHISQPNDCHDKGLGPGAMVRAPGSGQQIRPSYREVPIILGRDAGGKAQHRTECQRMVAIANDVFMSALLSMLKPS